METTELIDILSRGEDSRHQFKADVTNADALAGEIVAFSNTAGGRIFIGVNDDGSVRGLCRCRRGPPQSACRQRGIAERAPSCESAYR